MGKIRSAVMGDEKSEKEAKRKAQARRDTKKAKKAKVAGVGLKGGERTAVVEGTDIKPEFKKLVEKVEKGESTKEKGLPAGKAGKSTKEKEVKTKQRSKRYKEMRGMVDKSKLYPVKDAVDLMKKTQYASFDGTVELHVNLDTKNITGDKNFRGIMRLPHGTGKEVRVAIADDTVLSDIEKGTINFDILIAHPSIMPKLAKYAKLLGPRGLMPNPKNGTVSPEPEKKAKEMAGGQVNYKSEPNNPIIHLSIGKVSFDNKKIAENIKAVIDTIGASKISKLTLTSTMGPGIKVEI